MPLADALPGGDDGYGIFVAGRGIQLTDIEGGCRCND